MASDPTAGSKYRFLPFVREGFRPETPFERDRPDGSIPGPMTVGVELTLAARRAADGEWEEEPKPIAEGDLDRPTQDVRMYGPGDVIGIDEDHVSRLEPEPDSNSFPPNLFPLVEFSRADLPWLFSPERADVESGKSRNRPWLTLVVVPRADDDVSVESGGTNPLPVLETPASELPSLAQSWAWAHAQVVGDDRAASEVVVDEPERVVSRLVCPRNLEENTRYLAAVVPTFEPGRRVGLGRRPYPRSTGQSEADGEGEAHGDGEGEGEGDAGGESGDASQAIEFAWSGDEDAVRLPMYLHWEFHSGGGDFEELASRLSPTRLSSADVGRREVDVSEIGPDELGHHAPIHQTGALRAPSLALEEFPNADALEGVLNQPERLAGEQADSDEPAKPVVGAPLYGQWHREAETVDADSTAWFDDLNTALRYRIAAGLGADVIRENQESYVARAWEQVGELDAMNRRLAGGQLARAASTHVHDRLVGSVGLAGEKAPARLLQFTKPMHRTTGFGSPNVGSMRSFEASFDDMADFPNSVLTPTFRRLSRPKGPLLRNADVSLADGQFTASALGGDFEAERVTPAKLKTRLRTRVSTLDDLAGTQFGIGADLGRIGTDTPVPVDGVGGDGVWPGGGGWTGGGVDGPDGGVGPWVTPGLVNSGTSGLSRADVASGRDTLRARQNSGSGGVGRGALSDFDPRLGRVGRDVQSSGTDGAGWQLTSGTVDAPRDNKVDDVVRRPGDGIVLPGDSRYAPATYPAGLDVATPTLERVARIGSWAQSLPDVDLRRIDLSAVTPETPRAYAVRKVDVQAQSSIDHAATAHYQLEALADALDPSSGRGTLPSAPATVRAHADAVKANTFRSLFRTLDNLLTTAPDAAPSQVGADRDAFGDELRDDHDAAMDALDALSNTLAENGLDPSRPDLGASPDDDTTSTRGRLPEGVDLDALVANAREAASKMQSILDRLQYLQSTLRVGPDVLTPPVPGEGLELGPQYDRTAPEHILDHVDPEITVTSSVLSKVSTAGRLGNALAGRSDPIEPVAWAPRFPDATADALEALSQEYLLPGVSDVPRDSIGALSTDPAFVEAFLAGLNHEFARELLWRRFPTDRRGTYFDTFWDKTSNPLSTVDDRPDVADLHTWRGALGANAHDSGRAGAQFADQGRQDAQGEGRVVLVIRGELLRRFPDTSIYMVKSKADGDGDGGGRTPKLSALGHVTPDAVERGEVAGVKFPVFQGRLDPDVRFLGFDLPPSDAVGDPETGDPGWFFVFEEPMGETRFGLDTGTEDDRGEVPNGITAPAPGQSNGDALSLDSLTTTGESTTWNALSWNHLLAEGAGAGEHVDDLVTYLDLWDSPPGGGGKEDRTWRVTDDQIDSWTNDQQGLVEEFPSLATAFAQWGRNSAHMARITFQRPVRVSIHADDLLAPEVGQE
jgi:hypothetical protein